MIGDHLDLQFGIFVVEEFQDCPRGGVVDQFGAFAVIAREMDEEGLVQGWVNGGGLPVSSEVVVCCEIVVYLLEADSFLDLYLVGYGFPHFC